MPINVNYSPVGLLSSLAAQMGQGEGQQQQFQNSMAMQQAQTQNMIAQANIQHQNDAFALQKAMAERMAQQQTPVANHVEDALKFKQMSQHQDQIRVKQQLDIMLQSGTIQPADYQRAMLGVIAGDNNLMTKLFEPPTHQTGIPQGKQLDAQLQPLKSNKQLVFKQMMEYQRDTLGGKTDPQSEVTLKGFQDKMDEYDRQMDAIRQGYGIGGMQNQSAALGAGQTDPDEGRVIVNKATGERRIRRSGQWVPL